MRDLKDMVSLCNSESLAKIEVLNSTILRPGNLMGQFFTGLVNGHIQNDESAKKMLYGTEQPGVKYDMLKKRLRERLYTTLLFLRPKEKEGRTYSYNIFYCHKHYVVAMLLLTIGARNAGRRLFKKVLREAYNSQLFNVLMLTSEQLAYDAFLRGDVNGHIKYRKVFKRAKRLYHAETTAEELHRSWLIHFTKSIIPDQDLIKQVEKVSNILERFYGKYKTYNIGYRYFQNKIMELQLKGNYQEAVETCVEFENFLVNHRSFYSKRRHATLLAFKLDCLLHLSDFEEGERCAVEAASIYTEGVINWFIVMEMYFLLCIRSNQLDKAAQVILKRRVHENSSNQTQRQKDAWKLIEGYFWFILKYHGREDLLQKCFPGQEAPRVNKILNEIPVYSKDKRGYNIAALVLQVLHFLETRQYDQIISRTENLKYYVYKNVKKDELFRSHCFIKMIMALEKAEFEPDRVEKRVAKYLEAMKQRQYRHSVNHLYLEVIPYEKLWQMILHLLERQDAKAA